MNKKKINEHTEIGIDTVELNIIGVEKEIPETELFSSRTNKKIGNIKKRSRKETGYCVSINLPRTIRDNNVHPITVLDSILLDEIVNEI